MISGRPVPMPIFLPGFAPADYVKGQAHLPHDPVDEPADRGAESEGYLARADRKALHPTAGADKLPDEMNLESVPGISNGIESVIVYRVREMKVAGKFPSGTSVDRLEIEGCGSEFGLRCHVVS